MILERIQKHLRSIFILMLVFTQGMIFVASRAATDEYDLRATFVEPIAGQNIEIGTLLNLEANIESDETTDFSQVFFTVASLETDQEMNFEAYKQDENYVSVGTWDTNLWPAGMYQMFVSVNQYDSDGILDRVYRSQPELINLYKNNKIKIAAELATPLIGQVEFTHPDPDIAFPPGEVISISVTSFEISAEYALDVGQSSIKIYPYNHVSSGNVLLDLDVNHSDGNNWGAYNVDISALANGQYTAIFEGLAVEGNSGGDNGGIEDLQYTSLASSVHFTVDRTSVPPEDTLLQVPQLQIISPQPNQELGGDFTIKVGVEEGSFADLDFDLRASLNGQLMTMSYDQVQSVPGMSTYSVLANINEEDFREADYTINFAAVVHHEDGGSVRYDFDETVTISVVYTNDYTIYLDNPESGTVASRDLTIELRTGFEADNINIVLTSQDGLFTKNTSFSGINDHWVWHQILDDTWPAGLSILNVLASNSEQTVEQDFSIYIESLVNENINPADVRLSVSDLGSLSGQVNLRAQANYSGLDVDFFVIDTVSENEVWRGTAGEVDQYYVVSFDTTQLSNGNYEILAEADVRGTIVTSSNSFVAQIYNEYEQGEEEQVIFDIRDDYKVNSTGRIITYYLTSSIPLGLVYDLELKDSELNVISPADINYDTYISMFNERWSILEANGILQADNAATPYAGKIQVKLSDNNIYFPDGKYYLTVNILDINQEIVASDELSFSAVNGLADNWQVSENEADQDQSEESDSEPETQDQAESSGSNTEVISRGTLLIGLYDSCVEVGISNQFACERFRATLDNLDFSCIEAGIYTVAACEDYLNRTQVDAECQEQNILNPTECQDYLLEKYGSNVDCRLADTSQCMELLRNKFLNRLVVGQKKQTVIDEVVDPLFGQSIKVFDLNQRLLQRGVSKNSIALQSSSDARVFLAKSSKETVLETEEKLTILNQAVMIIDSDGDGLSDDMEIYYGTDPADEDSDDDTYPDGTEVKNGYNPLGEGALEKQRTDFDKVILSDAVLEQPKTFSNKVDSQFEVADIENNNGQIYLQGKAAANTWVLIYLYSDLPLVMSTKTDASGNWTYDIKHSLADGHHQVYVTINDDTGKIVKQSKPMSFLINQAQAVTAEEYFDTESTPDNVQNFLIYYIIGGALLVLLALGIIIFIHSRKNQAPDIGSDNGQI